MGLNHKMGWRGTTNTALAMGEENQCVGELIGEACADEARLRNTMGKK
jgi:butyryl-CoA dehydrogenase